MNRHKVKYSRKEPIQKEESIMGTIRKNYTPTYKAKVALSAIREKETLEQLSSKYQISSTQIVRWKKEATDNLSFLFERKKDQQLKEKEAIIRDLYEQLGKLKMEYEWLKKKIETFNI